MGSRALLLLVMLVVAACAAPSPTNAPAPSGTPSQTSSPSSVAANYPLAPTAAVEEWIQYGLRGSFRPLTASELAAVRIPAAAAEQRALAEPGIGYGTAGGKVVFTKVGCVFLGFFTEPNEPSPGYVPPQLAAYLVQVLAPPVPAFPGINIELFVIDAESGEFLAGFGSSDLGPVLGTTCGVTP